MWIIFSRSNPAHEVERCSPGRAFFTFRMLRLAGMDVDIRRDPYILTY